MGDLASKSVLVCSLRGGGAPVRGRRAANARPLLTAGHAAASGEREPGGRFEATTPALHVRARVRDHRSRRASKVIGGVAIASWAATSCISRVPAAIVASSTAKTDDVVAARAWAGDPLLVRCAR
ncbi:MAG: hypothetical protein JWO76_2165 [Nocardioides sp.]|nr:hypothetical protein [Nocardioides sp.]